MKRQQQEKKMKEMCNVTNERRTKKKKIGKGNEEKNMAVKKEKKSARGS